MGSSHTEALRHLFGEICIARQISLHVVHHFPTSEDRDLVARYERKLYTFGRVVQAMEARYANREPPEGDVEFGSVGPEVGPNATKDELFGGIRAQLHIARCQLAQALLAMESPHDGAVLQREGQILEEYATAIGTLG